MRLAITIGLVGLVGLGLAGCQSTEQSMASAQSVCLEAGLRPGTKAFERCTNASFRNNVAQSNAAANQAVAGAAIGVLGGAAIGAAASRPRYYCHGWGCW